jgi:hypothetical protein
MSVSGGLPQDPKRLVAIRERTEAARMEMWRSLTALRLEAPDSVVDDVDAHVRAYESELLAEVERLREELILTEQKLVLTQIAVVDLVDAFQPIHSYYYNAPSYPADLRHAATVALATTPNMRAVSVPVGEGER